jgi:hypothetical protein
LLTGRIWPIWKNSLKVCVFLLVVRLVYLIFVVAIRIKFPHAVSYDFENRTIAIGIAQAALFSPLIVALCYLRTSKNILNILKKIILAFYVIILLLHVYDLTGASSETLRPDATIRNGKFIGEASFNRADSVNLYESKIIVPGIVETKFIRLQRHCTNVEFLINDKGATVARCYFCFGIPHSMQVSEIELPQW